MKQALLKLHAAVFLWGFTGVLGRAISLNEGMLVWYRMAITVISLWVLQWFFRGSRYPGHAAFLRLSGTGSILALHWCFFFASIKYSNVSISLTCLSSAGLFTAILAPVFNRVRISVIEILLGLIGITGIYLIFHFDPHYKTGIILGLIASLLSCIYTIITEKQVVSKTPDTVILYQLSGGFLTLSLLMPIYLYYTAVETYLPKEWDWLLLFILSWVCTILAMKLSIQSLKVLSAFTQNLTINLEPVYGIILAFLIYQENKNLSSGFYAGFALIAIAVIIQMSRVVKSRHITT